MVSFALWRRRRPAVDGRRSTGGAGAARRFARFARTQRSGVLLAPGLGEHSREVLAGVGLEEATIEELVSRGVVVEGGPLSVQAFFEYR